MNALIMILLNTKQNTFHPIMYWESLLPGGYESESNQKLIRYKSKGHHTAGFKDRKEALLSIANDLTDKLKGMGFTVNQELEGNLEWDGLSIPADIQMRSRI